MGLLPEATQAGKWNSRCDLVNNWLRRFKTLCKQAGVGQFTIHDLPPKLHHELARKLPIHVTQQLAGHSDIHTTQSYYLSVQAEDLVKAKRMQTKLMIGLKDAPPTDPKLTPSAQKRDFPKRKEFGGVAQPPQI